MTKIAFELPQMKRGRWRNSSSGWATTTPKGCPLATTAAKSATPCLPASTSCSAPYVKPALHRDDDEKADPHPGAGFSSRSDTPYTQTCTPDSAQHCGRWKGARPWGSDHGYR